MKIKQVGALLMVVGMSFSGAAWAAGEDEQPVARIIMSPAITLLPASVLVPSMKRPAALPALYVALGVLQGLDIYSTAAALKAGAHEANAVAAPFAHNSGSLLGLKIATTASTIFFTERMWKKNRIAAVATLVAINGVTAAVAMRNMRNARGTR